MRLTLTSHWDLVLPDRLRLRWHEVTDLSRHVTRADRVGASEAYPLDGEGFACGVLVISSQIIQTTVVGVTEGRTKVNNTSLSSVVRSLQLRDVDNMSAHARRSDKASVREVLELLAVDGGALGLLAAPVLTSRARRVEGSIQISGDDLLVVGELAVERGTLRPWDAGVGDEDVETAVEVGDGLVDGLLDGLVGGDVYLVCLACGVVLVICLFSFELLARGLWLRCGDVIGFYLHLTPKVFSIFSASWMAFLLLLYQMATLAPASARAWATARPIPAPAPETMAVRPLREKRGSTRSVYLGASVLLWVNWPATMVSPAMVKVVVVVVVKVIEERESVCLSEAVKGYIDCG